MKVEILALVSEGVAIRFEAALREAARIIFSEQEQAPDDVEDVRVVVDVSTTRITRGAAEKLRTKEAE